MHPLPFVAVWAKSQHDERQIGGARQRVIEELPMMSNTMFTISPNVIPPEDRGDEAEPVMAESHLVYRSPPLAVPFVIKNITRQAVKKNIIL